MTNRAILSEPGVATETPTASSLDPRTVPSNPWLAVSEAAVRARCGVKTIYREVRAGRLRAARIGGRRELRVKPEWVDEWLIRAAGPQLG